MSWVTKMFGVQRRRTKDEITETLSENLKKHNDAVQHKEVDIPANFTGDSLENLRKNFEKLKYEKEQMKRKLAKISEQSEKRKESLQNQIERNQKLQAAVKNQAERNQKLQSANTTLRSRLDQSRPFLR